MWPCKRCGEEVDDHFAACWNCGANRAGDVVEDQGEADNESNEPDEMAPQKPSVSEPPKQSSPSRAAKTRTPRTVKRPIQADLEASGANRPRTGAISVEVVNIRMGFWAMVVFMVKWAIATIPALIILLLIVAAVATALAGSVAGLLSQFV